MRDAVNTAVMRPGAGLPKMIAPRNANAAAARRVRTHLTKAS